MPRRSILIRIVQAGALAIGVGVFVGIVLQSSGGGDELPEPPDGATRVVKGDAGWYIALNDEPVSPFDWLNLWVHVDGLLDDPSVTEPPPIQLKFEPADRLPFPIQPEISGYRLLDVKNYRLSDDVAWFETYNSIYLPEGDYQVVISLASDETHLAEADIHIAFAGKIAGINIQRWEAESIVIEEFSRPSEFSQGCWADPFDEATGLWTVNCERGDVRSTFTVDAQTGELTQASGPPLEPKETPNCPDGAIITSTGACIGVYR